ncbi:hypothetical protein B0J11DRAFT_505851 [Dendryphion nanum]|uniref:Protein kinase domain-containing protein n=1 Tax=Dendryphion nanum TaxID=256645 RepID=A0A9P9INJ2_9PLEO|nr:hypothetical protein B0J11DRAFT_505851 [Dendryphion nanum]
MPDDFQISSWAPAQEIVQFSANNASKMESGLVENEHSAAREFHSSTNTSLYTTLLDVLSPAAQINLECYKYEDLLNHIGRSLSHGKGSQFETFYARLKIPFDPEDLVNPRSIVVVKRMLREDPKEISVKQRWESVRREFQVLCYPPFRESENIVKLLAFGWERDYAAPILIQEYADLGTLGSYLDRTDVLSRKAQRQLCLDISSGIEALHAADIIHGDIKPANILMFTTEDEKSPRAKIADFGMIISETTSTSEYYLGTPHWTPPETWNGDKIPIKNLKACDVFSLGLVFWAISRNSSSYLDPADDQEQAAFQTTKTIIQRSMDRQSIQNHKHRQKKGLSNLPHILSGLRSSLAHHHASTGTTIETSKPREGSEMLQLALKSLKSRDTQGGEEQNVPGWLGTALTYSLQIDPEARKPVKEIAELLNPDKSRTRTRLHEIANWGMLFNIPLDAQRQVVSELLEQLDRTQECVDVDTVMDLVFCFSEGFGHVADHVAMMAALQIAASAGEWRAATLLVRMGGKISARQQQFFDDCIQVVQPDPEIPKLFLFLNAKSQEKETQETFWNSLLKSEALVRRGQALRDGLTRVLMIGEYIPGTTEELQDLWNRKLHYYVLDQDVEELDRLKAKTRSKHSTWDARSAESFETPLLVASRYGSPATVNFLISVGANPLLANEMGVMPLHMLGMFPTSDIPLMAKKLAPSGFPLNSIGRERMPQVFTRFWGTPLHWAIQMRSLAAVKAMLELGANINFEGDVRAPLELATELYAYEIVELLLDRGAKTSQCRQVGDELKPFPSLHTIGDMSSIHPMILPKRLMHGRRLENSVGLTIRAYLRHGIDIDVVDHAGSTALFSTCLNPAPNDFVLRSLIENGADVPGKHCQAIAMVLGSTKASSGSEATALPKLQILLDHSSYAQVNHYDKTTFTYLHQCASLDLPSMLAAFISHGAIVNAVSLNYRDDHPIDPSQFRSDDRLETPLDMAAALDSPQCVSVLLARGANVNVLTGIEGEGVQNTPLATAVTYGGDRVVDVVMKEKNVTIWLPRVGSETPSVLNLPHFRRLCSVSKRTDIIEFLLWNYKSTFARREVLHATLAGFNPMHGAIALGDKISVQRLLEAGTDPNSQALVGDDPIFKRPTIILGAFLGSDGPVHLAPMREMFPEAFSSVPGEFHRFPQPGPISSIRLALVLRHTPELEWSSRPTPDWLEANLAIIHVLLKAGATVTAADVDVMSSKGDDVVVELLASHVRTENPLLSSEK